VQILAVDNFSKFASSKNEKARGRQGKKFGHAPVFPFGVALNFPETPLAPFQSLHAEGVSLLQDAPTAKQAN